MPIRSCMAAGWLNAELLQDLLEGRHDLEHHEREHGRPEQHHADQVESPLRHAAENLLALVVRAEGPPQRSAEIARLLPQFRGKQHRLGEMQTRTLQGQRQGQAGLQVFGQVVGAVADMIPPLGREGPGRRVERYVPLRRKHQSPQQRSALGAAEAIHERRKNQAQDDPGGDKEGTGDQPHESQTAPR